MKKTFFKNLFRDIRKTLSRFLSIVIIIAIGVSFYAGVRATSPDMKISADSYFNSNNLMDFKLISTLGLTKDDLEEVKKEKGVTAAEGAYSLDAVVIKEDHSLVLNINTLPSESGINAIKLVDGRRPKNNTEAIAEDKFLKENNLKIGDKIKLQSGNDTNIGDKLKNTEFEIVGSAKSPMYASGQRQLSSVGNGSVRGFVYILPEVFKSEVYTEIYVRAESEESKNSLLENEKYKEEISSIEKDFKNLGLKRSEVRYLDVMKTAEDKLKEAEDKLNSSKKEAADKFADAHKKLEDGRIKLEQGKAELKKNVDLYNKKISDGEKQIADGKKAIQDGETKLNASALEIENGKTALAAGKKQLEDQLSKLNEGKKLAADDISNGMQGQLIALKASLDKDPTNPMLIMQYNTLNQAFNNGIKGKDFDSMYSFLKSSGMLAQMPNSKDLDDLNNASNQINRAKSEISSKENTLIAGEKQLLSGRSELESSKEKIADAEVELNKGKTEGTTKLNDAKKKLEDGEKELNENSVKLKDEEEKANNKINDAENEIQKNRDKLKDIKNPEWYVLGRSQNVGYENYRQDSDRIDNIGKAFPLIFFLVAALVSLTTMTRMVQENRIEIGTFKALGYSRTAIVAHYLIYSLSASVLGSVIGVSFGFKLFPPLIMNAYTSLYAIPNSLTPFNTTLALEACLIAILFTTVSAVAATLDELREVPASLLRPKPPKSGKKIFLEKLPFIWKRLSFTRKVTARNIFRYKQRFFMTVIGIAACTGLMITGYGLKDGILGAVEKQFNDIYTYDMQTSLTQNVDNDEKNNIEDKIYSNQNIKSILFTYSKNSTIKKADSSDEDAYLVVPEKSDELNKYINLSMKGKKLQLTDDGVIITEKLSKLVNKKVGDIIEITVNDKVMKAKVAAITEHYVQHYVYMSSNYYKKLSGEDVKYSGFFALIKDKSKDTENKIAESFNNIDKVGSTSFKNSTHLDFNKSMDSINSVVLILIASAGVLAFVVIYNLTNINISERRRELATIKLLGFYNHELAAYIYRENMILTVIGSITGIVVGIFINNFVVSAAETNVIMFLRTIKPIYFLYSVLLTILFSIIVNLAMYKRFDKIDMIESLKNAE
ncbi:FtsX-like permease family protein [Clostridium folliculivorans]|uniref:Membrane protein n=1 Tax=Clostridium folliculivorans TaxID=2886038 RepID=A0A9W5Y1I6_9CLOT|nr:FtsX-like permease family protein [Clostridium folliculivorans]GKU24829.1 membrane protein [Clostridium folliculivorans]GKU30927.1 membrane protein [Clostridium folliculivorans]